MTKKEGLTNPNHQSKLKKGKIKRKEMFNQLETIHEQRINQKDQNMIQEGEQYFPFKIQEDRDENIVINKQKNIEQICEIVSQLMAKNKINSKNAFDVPIVDLFDIVNFQKNQNQNTWKTLSATLENDYKIYAYRVDAIHSITYSILNIISRRSVQTQQKLKPEVQNTLRSQKKAEFSDLKQSFLINTQNQKTNLQLDAQKINISSIQCAMTADPTLQRTKRLFDGPGLKGMLTNSVQINKNLQLSLLSNQRKQSYSMKLSHLQEVDTKLVEHPLKIFQSIQKIKSDVSKILNIGESKIITNKELQQVWANVKKRNFTDWADGNQKVWLDVEDPECRQNFDMMIDENSQNHPLFQNTHKKFIGDFIKMKSAVIGKKIMTDQQLLLDGQKWLGQIDKKFLGIKTVMKPLQNIKLNQPVINNDFIDFASQKTFQRDQILKKQNFAKQINEQIQDRFLTTIRPFHEFKIQKILTLRQQPDVQFFNIDEDKQIDLQHDHFLQKQIDVKRQMTSIKDMKEKILNEMQISKRQLGFKQVYQNYCEKQNQISPALCFLTVLHLANENNLHFESIQNETDFLIKLPVNN